MLPFFISKLCFDIRRYIPEQDLLNFALRKAPFRLLIRVKLVSFGETGEQRDECGWI